MRFSLGAMLHHVPRLRRDYLHGIADRRSDSTQHFSRVINASSIKAAHLRQALISAGVASEGQTSHTSQLGSERQQQRAGNLSTVEVERQTRVSITLRDVEKVNKGLSGILGRR